MGEGEGGGESFLFPPPLHPLPPREGILLGVIVSRYKCIHHPKGLDG